MGAFEVMVQEVRGYFMTHATKPAQWRRRQLLALKEMLTKHEMEWAEAMAADLGRPMLEARAEVVIALYELNTALKSMHKWISPEKIATPALIWPCNSEVPDHVGFRV
eukprot:3073422-Rhodomonas_salina.2